MRTPKTPDQARLQVRELKAAGVDAIKAVLETGRTGMLFARMDLAMFHAVIEESNAQRLPASVHTGSARDVEDAVDTGAGSIEHGSFSDAIPDAVLARMAKNAIAYDPTLSVLEAIRDLPAGRGDLLRRSLVQHSVSQKLLSGTAAAIKDGKFTNTERARGIDEAIRIAHDNLRRAWKAGVTLVTGGGAGNLLVFHGPTVHRELQLWVEAGRIPFSSTRYRSSRRYLAVSAARIAVRRFFTPTAAGRPFTITDGVVDTFCARASSRADAAAAATSALSMSARNRSASRPS